MTKLTPRQIHNNMMADTRHFIRNAPMAEVQELKQKLLKRYQETKEGKQ